MAKPSLDIALGSPDITAFKNKMQETSNHVGTVARQIAKQFLDLNKGIEAGLMASASRMALGMVGKVALVVGSYKLMSAAVSAAREQLEQMVSVADKANASGLSPEFWQAWVNGAKGATEKVALFEGALGNAYQALKPVLNPDWSVWDEGLKKVTAVEQAMREMRELFSTDQDSSGLSMFRAATTQDQRIVAVLTYMKQLQAIGQELAALDLADKLFGAKFADQIRQGTLSVDQLLDDLKTKSADAFSNEIVTRAKKLDDELKNAWRTLDQNLHPALEAIDNIVLNIKGEWLKIVQLMGDAAALSNKIRPGTGYQGGVSAFDLDQQTLLKNRLNDTGLTPQQRSGVEKQLHEIESRIAQAQASEVPQAPVNFSYGGNSAVPLPKRRPDDAPKPPKPTDTTTVDKLGAAADSIQKRTAALQAEAGAIDQTTAARERAKVVAQLETVAMQANAAAGKGANVVTDEQRRKINEVADAYSKAAEAMQKARVASAIKFDTQTALLDPSDVQIASALKGLYPDVATALNSVEASAMRANEAMRGIANTMSSTLTTGLTDVLDGTKSVSDAFSSMGKTILRAIEEALVKLLIVGPIMRSLSGMMGGMGGGLGGGLGGIGLSLLGTGGLFADGGEVRGPGGPRDDRIPIMASNGEFVVRADATARHLPLLHAINQNRIPRFADGGLIGNPANDNRFASNDNRTSFAPTINVKVDGGSRGMQADEALAKSIGAQVESQIRTLMAKELRTQMRPGGILKR